MDDAARYSSLVKARALNLGFDACGISSVAPLHEDAEKLRSWLKYRYHAGMAYMEKNIAKRTDPSLLYPGTLSVISVLLNYNTSERQKDPKAPVLSKYAFGSDYHRVIKKKLLQLLQCIREDRGNVNGRAFVDSAPVFDRSLAVRAGLGWIGKNSNLISPLHGSFVFIGHLMVDIPLGFDTPVKRTCGSCRKCLDACPTNAIVRPYIIDSNRCISYLTIENRGIIPEAFRGRMMNRVFGCDICQEVCPFNRKSPIHREAELDARPEMLAMSRDDWQQMDEKQFLRIFSGTAVMRAGYKGIRRNLEAIL